MYTEPALNISPVTESRLEALRSAHRARSRFDSCWFDFDATSVFGTPPSNFPLQPLLHKPASVFAQPERMLASHYSAHANFVSLQLFNGHASVFVCFLAIRLLHLYGWSGGWKKSLASVQRVGEGFRNSQR